MRKKNLGRRSHGKKQIKAKQMEMPLRKILY